MASDLKWSKYEFTKQMQLTKQIKYLAYLSTQYAVKIKIFF